MLLFVLGITALAGVGGTGLGGLLAVLLSRRRSEKAVSLLLSYAAGVMAALVLLELLPEALSAGGQRSTAVALGLGCFATAALEDLFRTGKKQRKGLYLSGWITAAAIAIHNVPEGMVIGAACALDGTASSGIAMALVIGLHNIPEGMAVSSPLSGSGSGRTYAAFVAALAGAPTVLGALIGYSMGAMGAAALTLALGFAGGAMLYVAFVRLLPESARSWRSRIPAWAALAGIFTGLALLGA